MGLSVSLDAFMKYLRDSRRMKTEHIADYLDEIAKAAQHLATIWEKIFVLLEEGITNPMQERSVKSVVSSLQKMTLE